MTKTRQVFKTKPKNKIIQDCTGTEIDFFDVPVNDVPEQGDEAKVDDKPAEGNYVMSTGEIYQFSQGILTKILEPKRKTQSKGQGY